MKRVILGSLLSCMLVGQAFADWTEIKKGAFSVLGTGLVCGAIGGVSLGWKKENGYCLNYLKGFSAGALGALVYGGCKALAGNNDYGKGSLVGALAAVPIGFSSTFLVLLAADVKFGFFH